MLELKSETQQSPVRQDNPDFIADDPSIPIFANTSLFVFCLNEANYNIFVTLLMVFTQ